MGNWALVYSTWRAAVLFTNGGSAIKELTVGIDSQAPE